MYYPYAQPTPRFRQRTMTVSGTGKISKTPNVVHIQFEVRTENPSLQTAQQQNAQTMQQLIGALQSAGIAKEDMQTTAFTVQPQYDYVEGQQRFRGYEVVNQITVKTESVESIGEIIDIAIQNGANRVTQLQFGLQDEQTAYEEALSLALKNAYSKAQTIAETMQLQLNPTPIKISEESQGGRSARLLFAAKETAATPIEQGQIEIIAVVTVQFQY
ncbi:SIMPL domain-containing protein [Sporosarcina sp. HYO08]|uniref:SIMPL domain-containing protein n=1 Tax=Sporosarcina sp. HYO08 TaxID=1759557 RepID=UPI00079B1123|nr:SIMPL domain-containing protein [Sporosarcina sp. HYO08]KXH87080.1 hypothetical protein AU377_00425 [Sporosarcina sp. HYO08]